MAIGSRIGKFIEVDQSTLEGMNHSIKIRVEVDLRKKENDGYDVLEECKLPFGDWMRASPMKLAKVESVDGW
ncbi:conserved hypothetical protein [Ricinus communis]|uniref:Uncharacterized protein n=1 Tax=Ricinus communis TaxID=3988 RepID=B9SJP6_RICCO|nr:conserved hypothetical protein [Ricinus communis]